MSSNEVKGGSIKKYKGLYATAVYGFIALFVVIVYPFVPLYNEGSLFESGLRMFNAYVKGNLIVTISMLIHSIILLIVGLVFIHKLKKYRAGVGYSFYKLFKITIILAMLTYVGFVVTGFETVMYESYGLEYWYVVLGIYLLGLIFALFAHLANGELRASKGKGLYLFFSLVAQWGIYFLIVNRSATVTNGYLYDLVKSEAGFVMSCSQNVSLINEVQNVYHYVLLAMLAFATISTASICMPVNGPFQYMTKRALKNTKYGRISNFLPTLRLITACIMTFCIIVNGGNEEILLCVLVLILTVADVVGVKTYNNVVASKFQPEEPILQTQSSVEDGTAETATVDGATEIVNEEETFDSDVILWDEEKLVAQGENHSFKGKSSIADICERLQGALSTNGITAQLKDVQLTFASILSSKVIFVKSNANSDMIRRFAETVSEFFNGELFFETRKNVLFGAESSLEETHINQSEKLTNIKYGVVSGLLVSNYLHDVFGLVFVDNTKGGEFASLDVALINSLVENVQNANVGKLHNLPETENYCDGNIKLSETARFIVFINESQMMNLEDSWIKYSSIVELNLEDSIRDYSKEIDKNISSYGMIYETLEETEETCFLTEDYWRKLDRLEEYLEENTDIRFDNRFIRQIENNVAAIMSCGMDKMRATDTILATKIIPLVATQKDKIMQAQEDFSFKLDELFGFENIPETKTALTSYGLKK